MTIGTIVSVIVIIVGFVSTWGAIRQSIKHLEEQFKYLNEKFDKHLNHHK